MVDSSAGQVLPSDGSLGEPELCRAVLDRLPSEAAFVFGPDLRCVFAAGGALSRWTTDELLGRSPADLLPADEAAVLEEHYRAALVGETRHHEHPGIRPPGAVWSSTISPLHDAAGSIVGVVAICRDVSEARQAQEARDRLEASAASSTRRADFERWQRERLEFLNEVNEVLLSCTDRRDVMRSVTAVAVPRLGDWCTIHVFLDEAASVPELEVGHVDPAMVNYARELVERFPYDPGAPVGVPRVIRTGEPELFSAIRDEDLAALGDSAGEAAEVIHELDLRSAVTVPLVLGQKVLGAMQFVISGEGRAYDADDMALAQAVAGRVASAVENHRLMERQREIAHTLQQSLLPERLPDVPGLEAAVAYWAAGEGAEVGGDFYDLFEIEEGRFGVVIGDVCGSGPRAAALTSLARQSVRFCAWRGDGPAQVLTHVNAAIRRSEAASFLTLVYGEILLDEGHPSLTLASGGHPAPIVVSAEGTARMIMPTGPLVAGFADANFGEVTVQLEAGEMIVLYTDGATDLRPPGGLSDEELLSLVVRSAGTAEHAQEVVMRLFEELEGRAPFGDRQDDVALMVLRAAPAEAAAAP